MKLCIHTLTRKPNSHVAHALQRFVQPGVTLLEATVTLQGLACKLRICDHPYVHVSDCKAWTIVRCYLSSGPNNSSLERRYIRS